VLHNGACLGAVAVSGLSGEDDLAIADIGVSAILNRLD
jgi:glc operon protein GlcG